MIWNRGVAVLWAYWAVLGGLLFAVVYYLVNWIRRQR